MPKGLKNIKSSGLKIIITAGGTIEPIDPVRYIGNRSSGKMGIALLQASLEAGFKPVIITANVSVPLPAGKYRRIRALSAEKMFGAVKKEFTAGSVLIMAAAVADFKPLTAAKHKIKKSDKKIVLGLVPGRDILKELAKNKKNRYIVGFSAETNNIIENSLRKMREKKMDLLVINDIGRNDIGFGSDYNEVDLVEPSGNIEHIHRAPKISIARRIISKILSLIKEGSQRQIL